MRLIPTEELGMSLKNLKKISLFYFLLSFNLYSQNSLGDQNKKNPIEKVTVLTDQYFSESVDAKTNVTQFFRDDLEKIPNSYLQDLVEFTPGMTFTGGTSKGRFYQMRGIGERSSYEGIPNYSIALTLDDIDYSGFGHIMNLSDVETVSIQKGPQLTTQGPNGIGGVISMKTSATTSEFSGRTQVGYGNYNTKNAAISLSSSLTENLSMRVSSQLYQSDGYIKNTYFADEDTNYSNDKSFKVKLNYDLGDWDLVYNFHHFNYKSGYDVFNQTNSLITTSDHPGVDLNEINAHSLRIEKQLGSVLSSTILTYLNSQSEYSYDEDWSNDAFWNQLDGWNQAYNYFITFPKERRRYSLDQRFYFNGRKFNSHLGVYLRSDEENTTEWGFQDEAQRKRIKSNLDTKQAAVYGQSVYSISNHLDLIFGARLENKEFDYADNAGQSAGPKDLLWGAELSAVYIPSSTMRTYFKLARGFKSGGVNVQDGIPNERKSYGEELVYLSELGTSYRDNRGNGVKLAGYFMFRDDIQVKTSFQDDPTDPSSYTFYQDNAAQATTWGLEWEGSYYLTKNLKFLGAGSLMHSSLGDYAYGARNLKDREIAYAPEYQFNLSLDYEGDKGFFFNSVVSFQDNYYFGNSHDQKGKTTQLIHMNVGYLFSWGRLQLWSRNILNEKIESRGFFFSNEPPDWVDKRYVHRGAPRTFGLNLFIDI